MTITASEMKVGTKHDPRSGTETTHHYATLRLTNATLRTTVEVDGSNNVYVVADIHEVELRQLQEQIQSCLINHNAAKAMAQAQAQDGASA